MDISFFQKLGSSANFLTVGVDNHKFFYSRLYTWHFKNFVLIYNHIPQGKVVKGMKQSNLQSSRDMFTNVFTGFGPVLRFTFKATDTRDKCAHLAVLNHQLGMTSAITRGQSAHLHKVVLNACHYMS